MIEADRFIAPQQTREEELLDRAIRPKLLADYQGQDHVRSQMEIFIEAARRREEALDHLLIFGPPGLDRRAGDQGFKLRLDLARLDDPVVQQVRLLARRPEGGQGVLRPAGGGVQLADRLGEIECGGQHMGQR